MAVAVVAEDGVVDADVVAVEVGEVVDHMTVAAAVVVVVTRHGIAHGKTRTRRGEQITIGRGDTTRRWLVWEDRARLVIGVCNVNGMRTCTRLEFNDGAATDFQNTGAETSWNGSIDLD